MTDDGFDITRRKILGAVGTVGVASAGAGLGTTAFFSDTESFNNNSLTAGELDLKLDFEEHYYDESKEEATKRVEQASDPASADYVLPGLGATDQFKGSNIEGVQSSMMVDEETSPIALNFVDPDGSEPSQVIKDEFWDATSIDALPDSNDDGIQELPNDPCSALPDFGQDEDGLSSSDRTSEYQGYPLIQLGDVKPGDFGEVTFSFHLCGNPGYVWLTGEKRSASENGVVEPEASDPQEDQNIDGDLKDSDSDNEKTVELLDNVVTRFWYDDCDNQVDTALADKVDIMVAVDTSGSVDSYKSAIEDGVERFAGAIPDDADVQIGALSFGNNSVSVEQVLDDPSSFGYGPSDDQFGGNTPLPATLEIRHQILQNKGRKESLKEIIVITGGGPNYRSDKTYSADYNGTTYTGPAGGATYSAGTTGQDGNVTKAELDETKEIAAGVRSGGTRIATVFTGDSSFALQSNKYGTLDEYLANQIASSDLAFRVGDSGSVGDNIKLLNDDEIAAQLVISTVVGEEVFFVGTLRQALMALSGDGIPLDAGRSTEFSEVDGPADSDAREPFEGNGTTHCIGFEWWLPVDHANQIQTDSVEFDIGFRTEQARHNDGATS